MKRLRLLLFLALASPLGAADQPLRFGAAFPLPNTSYGTASAVPRLVVAGDELYAFWATVTDVRMTRVGAERRSGVPVYTFKTGGVQLAYWQPWIQRAGAAFDVVWTGSHFLLAVEQGRNIVAQTLDRSGQALAAPVRTVSDAMAPDLAFNGGTGLLLYRTWEGFNSRSTIVTADGQVAASGDALGGGRGAYLLIEDGDGFAAVVLESAGAFLKTFDSAGRLQSSTFATTDYVTGLAANADGWLLTTTGSNGRSVRALFVDRARTVGTPLTLIERAIADGISFETATAAWNGREWVVTYTETIIFPTPSKHRFHVVTLDPRATRITDEREPIAGRSAGVTQTVAGTTWISWYPDQLVPPPAPLFAEFPLHRPELAEPWTLRAGDHHLLATASSAEATLVVWREEINDELRVRAGIRTRSGGWSERTIGTATYGTHAIARSDGRNFLVALGDTMIRLDSRGAKMTPDVKLGTSISGIGWNGRRWVLTHGANGKLNAIFLAPAGSAIETAEIDVDNGFELVHDVVLAFDGDGFAVAWAVGAECMILPCHGARVIKAMRVTADFAPRDAGEFTLASSDEDWGAFAGPAVVWTGSEYVVAWSTYGTIEAVTLPKSGGAPSPQFTLADGGWVDDGLRASRDGIAVLAEQHEVPAYIVTVHDRAQGVVRSRTFDQTNAILNGQPRIELLPDRRLGFFIARAIPDAPQHGATHVVMAVQDAVSIPGAPLLAAHHENEAVHLSWTAAPGAVTGYRLEYRINDGSWNELSRWFGPDERVTTFRLPVTATRSAFRVRAWSEAGTGPYSDPVEPTTPATPPPPGKRRAVR